MSDKMKTSLPTAGKNPLGPVFVVGSHIMATVMAYGLHVSPSSLSFLCPALAIPGVTKKMSQKKGSKKT